VETNLHDVAGGHEMYAHLPGVALEVGSRASFGIGELVALDFAEWLAIDWTFRPVPDSYDFRQVKPVFFHASVATLPDSGNQSQSARDRSTAPYEALLIGTGKPFADPKLSVSYHRSGEAEWEILLGPFEHEYAVFGGFQFRAALSEPVLERSRTVLPLLERWKSPEVDAGLASLKRTALPEFSSMNAFLHNVTFLESMLIPELRERLTEAFARRGATLLSDREEEIASNHRVCRALYRARSEAMHGDDPAATIAQTGETTERFLGLARELVGEALFRLMLFTRRHGDIESAASALRQELARAWDDIDVRTTLRTAFADA
jgi:hypothetical protein